MTDIRTTMVVSADAVLLPAEGSTIGWELWSTVAPAAAKAFPGQVVVVTLSVRRATVEEVNQCSKS